MGLTITSPLVRPGSTGGPLARLDPEREPEASEVYTGSAVTKWIAGVVLVAAVLRPAPPADRLKIASRTVQTALWSCGQS